MNESSLKYDVLNVPGLINPNPHSQVSGLKFSMYIYMTVYGKGGHFTQKLKLRYRLQK